MLFPPGSIHTVLLDVDGTLLDSRAMMIASFEHSCAANNVPYPGWEVVGQQVGLPLEEIYHSIDEQLVDLLVESHRSFQETNAELAVAFPGAAQALHDLRRLGLATAAVTSRSRRTSVKTLELTGLVPLLDAIVSAEDGGALKPDPAPLRHALNLLHREPAGAVMVGDSEADIFAGRALGIPTIAATYGFAGERVLEAGPDAVINDIRELAELLGG